jgi:selenoprotein W-related protein
LTDEILTGWPHDIEAIELVASSGGRFEVALDGELIFSKAVLGRHAQPGELAGLLRDRLGPETAPR